MLVILPLLSLLRGMFSLLATRDALANARLLIFRLSYMCSLKFNGWDGTSKRSGAAQRGLAKAKQTLLMLEKAYYFSAPAPSPAV